MSGSPVLAVNAFHIAGSVLAAWAVLLAFLGLSRASFPGGERGGRLVSLVSLVLVAGAISTAVVTASNEDEEEGEARAGEAAPAGEAPAGEAPAGEAPAGGEKLALGADPGGQLAFDKTTLEAKAGAVTIDLKNPAAVPHNVSLEGAGVDEEGKTVEKDGVSTVSAELKPGDYTYYCSVPGHREGGMEGKLSVR